jgi:alkylation response protein AidB-like acyl-CoA dehydrogenase
VEDVDSFAQRARSWIDSNIPRLREVAESRSTSEQVELARRLQQSIFDAGFAGITWPEEYGGQSLTAAHMQAFSNALHGHENPYFMLSVSLGVIGPTLLEFGTAEQKAAYLPDLLRGDTLWVQFLSEPSGGSDMAGVRTRATLDGETWVMNGSKVWTTFGDLADYSLCLARTNWDVPKHSGLSMFVVPLGVPGITVQQISLASGKSDFCQEYLDDVVLPRDSLVGHEGDGWTVASRLLVHERTALGGGSKYFSAGSVGEDGGDEDQQLVDLAIALGRRADPHARQLVGELRSSTVVGEQLAARVASGIRIGSLDGNFGSLLKLYSADLHLRRCEVAMELGGSVSVAWDDADSTSSFHAMRWLVRQGQAILGGTNEIQRNIISERVLGLPREAAPDKDVPFKRVPASRETSP